MKTPGLSEDAGTRGCGAGDDSCVPDGAVVPAAVVTGPDTPPAPALPLVVVLADVELSLDPLDAFRGTALAESRMTSSSSGSPCSSAFAVFLANSAVIFGGSGGTFLLV